MRRAMMRRMPSLWRLVPLLAAAAGLSQCKRDSLDTLYKGVFTYGTDQPVYPPWYMGDNPENGEGFEIRRCLCRRRQVRLPPRGAATSVGGVNPVAVYNTNGDAKMALSSGEIDALVADLPTAFSVANELRDGIIVGQLPAVTEDVERFGIILNKDSTLARCVSSAVDALRDDGMLAALQNTWLAEAGNAPVLR
jgi:hypothetical protein